MDIDDEFDAFLEEQEEKQFNCEVQNELILYRRTGDARFVWRAIALFAEARKELPTPFVNVLARWASRIQQLQDPALLAAALELSGDRRRKIGPSHSAAEEARWRLASEVLQVRKNHPSLSLGQAFAVVARNRGLTVGKVKKIYHQTFPRPPRAPAGNDLATAWP